MSIISQRGATRSLQARITANGRRSEKFNSIVIVVVGPEEKKSLVYRDMICDQSEFFASRCSGRWDHLNGSAEKDTAAATTGTANGESGVANTEPITTPIIRLPEEDPLIFALFLEWMYSGCRELDLSHIDHALDEADLMDSRLGISIRVFLFADKY